MKSNGNTATSTPNFNDIREKEYSNDFVNVYKRKQNFREGYGDIISIRVPLEIKVIWNALGKKDKRALKEAFQAIINEYAGKKAEQEKNININVNINQIEQKVEIDVNEKLLTILQRLYKLREPLPPLQKQLIEQALKEAEKLLVP